MGKYLKTMSKTTKTILWIILAIIVIGLVWYAVSKKPETVTKEEETIKIGVTLPLTGPVAQFGQWRLRGMQLAVDEINTAGGIDGKKLDLILEDDRALPAEAQKIVTKFINVDNVDYIIAGTSAVVPAVVSMVSDKLIFMPAFMPESVEANSNVFSMFPSLGYEMEILVNYIYNNLNLKKVSIMYVNNDLGLAAKNKFQERFIGVGGEIPLVETFGISDTDYRTQLIKIKNTKSEGLVIIMSGEGLGNILKQANELNLHIKYFGHTITESPVFLSVAGKAAEGIIYTYPFKLDQIEGSFLNKYKSKYNEAPEMYATASYDIIYTIAELVKKCGKNCNAGDVLTIDFSGAGGRIKFEKDRCRFSPIYLKTVKDGKFVFLE